MHRSPHPSASTQPKEGNRPHQATTPRCTQNIRTIYLDTRLGSPKECLLTSSLSACPWSRSANASNRQPQDAMRSRRLHRSPSTALLVPAVTGAVCTFLVRLQSVHSSHSAPHLHHYSACQTFSRFATRCIATPSHLYN